MYETEWSPRIARRPQRTAPSQILGEDAIMLRNIYRDFTILLMNSTFCDLFFKALFSISKILKNPFLQIH